MVNRLGSVYSPELFSSLLHCVFCLLFAGQTKTHCQRAVEALPDPAPLGAYVPQCDEDGNYVPRQVHGSTGYSWCVDQDGNEIPETRRAPFELPANCGGGTATNHR